MHGANGQLTQRDGDGPEADAIALFTSTSGGDGHCASNGGFLNGRARRLGPFSTAGARRLRAFVHYRSSHSAIVLIITCFFSDFSYIIYEKNRWRPGLRRVPCWMSLRCSPRQLANVALAASHPTSRAFGARRGLWCPNYGHLKLVECCKMCQLVWLKMYFDPFWGDALGRAHGRSQKIWKKRTTSSFPVSSPPLPSLPLASFPTSFLFFLFRLPSAPLSSP